MSFIIDPSRCFHDTKPFDAQVPQGTKNLTAMEVDIEGKKICGISPGGHGDCSMVLPALSWIKRNSPSTKVEFAVNAGFILSFFGHADLDHVFNCGAMNDPEVRRHYDYIFNFDGAITRNDDAEQMHGVDAHFRWIHAGIDFDKLESKDRIPKYVLHPGAITRAKQYLRFNDLEDRVVIILQLRSSTPLRNWLPENMRKLGRELGERGYTVLLMDSAGGWDFSGENVIWVRKDMIQSMEEAIALVSFSDMVVGPDSSFQHVAQGLYVPSVGLYGAFPAEYRIGYGDRAVGVECDRTIFRCSPCYYHKRGCAKGLPAPCMETITVEMVLETIEKQFEKHPPVEGKKKFPIPLQDACTFCGTAPPKTVDDKNPEWVECQRCGSSWMSGWHTHYGVSKEKTEAELMQEYEDVYQKAVHESADFINKFTDAEFKFKGFGGNLFILDYLCGTGALANALRAKDFTYRIMLVDPSRRAIKHARDEYKLPIVSYDMCKELNFPLSHLQQLIVLREVIHTYSRSELEHLLLKCRHFLIKDGRGCIYVETPLPDTDIPFACNFPSLEGLEYFLTTQGFIPLQSVTLSNGNVGVFARSVTNDQQNTIR